MAAADQIGPRAPNITDSHLAKQFWVDVFGKEVQSATTYSYTWIADQVGHVCIGIVLNFILVVILSIWLGVSPGWAEGGSVMLGVLGVAVWEYLAYRFSLAGATGLFPVDRQLLGANAIIAGVYMAIGVILGWAFRLSACWPIVGFLAALLVGVPCARRWLRQKIIWQKASLPYLSRLADVQRTVGLDKARKLQAMIDEGAPPAVDPRQIVIGGPVGSGRTGIAAGIGTEFAFKNAMVRYMSLATLLELAAQLPDPDYADDNGPDNIDYWPWYQAQVLIIDDIGPLIASHREVDQGNLERFDDILKTGLEPIASILARCHTVWVFGDLRRSAETTAKGATLDAFAGKIAAFCAASYKTRQSALVIELKTVHSRAEWIKPSKTIVESTDAELRTIPL